MTLQAAAQVRSRHEICADARRANCGECWQVPGKPCTPEGDHVARFGRALRRGLVTGPEMIAVLQTLDAFINTTIVRDTAGGAR